MDGQAAGGAVVEVARPSEQRLDLGELRARLQAWLRTVVPPNAEPTVTDPRLTDADGVFGQTVLFDAAWGRPPHRWSRPLAVTLAPRNGGVAVFPSHRIDRQFETMRAVGEASRVPVPAALWLEPDPAPLGAPFLVRQHPPGKTPPEALPYNFGSWLTEATPGQRATLRYSSIEVLVRVHGIAEPTRRLAFLSGTGSPPAGGAAALAEHVAGQRAYHRWVATQGPDAPIIGRCFDWLRGNWPRRVGQTVLSWGDARIGNISYHDFVPVAVLGWELAGFGPRELDLGWFLYRHRFVEDLASAAGVPGLPDLLRRDDVCAEYQAMCGYEPRDMDFFTLYAALRHAIILLRRRHRAIRAGQAGVPDDLDDLIPHRATLEAMLAGTYWDRHG